ncbi:MAG TPA: methylmalonyl Co-A mutase-associated GTPase MeaB [Cyclobacteriaceae bacterium]|jgi:LAO/AO transport system kinase
MYHKTKNRETSAYYIDGILKGDIPILSQAITLTESHLPPDQNIAGEVLEGILERTGNSIRIGITGIPGVGKSTFVESFGTHLTNLGKKIAILAVDPSSKFSGGSIMGDKTRMEQLARNPAAFIRPSPTGSNLGGVAAKTRESILLCEAAGFEIILVETVGVGQNELAVREMVDFFLLLMLARSGDELQGMKRGIMEMANLIAITKADGDNVEAANQARAQFHSALHLYSMPESDWKPKVITCSAFESKGLSEIWEAICEYENITRENDFWNIQRNRQLLQWFHSTMEWMLLENFKTSKGIPSIIKEMEKKIMNKSITPTRAAGEIVDQYNK